MRVRTYKNTDLTVSEVGFGLVDDFHRLVGKFYRGRSDRADA